MSKLDASSTFSIASALMDTVQTLLCEAGVLDFQEIVETNDVVIIITVKVLTSASWYFEVCRGNLHVNFSETHYTAVLFTQGLRSQ